MSQNAFQNGVVNYNATSEKWSKVMLKNLSLVGVYSRIAVDHSSELSDNSDAINLRIVDDKSITVADYYTRGGSAAEAGTEGTISYSKAKLDKVVLQLTDTPNVAVSFEQYALKTADVKFQAAIIDRAKYKLAQAIDTMVMDTILAAVPGGNTIPQFDATTAAEGDVYGLVLQIATILKKAGAIPLSNASDLFGDKGLQGTGYIVVNPDVMRFILKEPAFIKLDMADKDAMWKAGVVRGTIAGLVVLESSNLPTAGGTNLVNVFGGIKEATHFAVKKIADRMMDAENKYDVLWSTLFAAGAVVSNPDALAKVSVKVA